MKKIPVKETNGFIYPVQPLPEGLEVLCDGKFYYVLEHNSNKNAAAYKEFKAHKDKMETARKAAELANPVDPVIEGAS